MSYRLAWFGNHGVAQRGCRSTQLRAAPDLGGGAVHEMDFDPAHGVRIVRQRAVDAVGGPACTPAALFAIGSSGTCSTCTGP